jgi:deoxyribodipyrimidine photo-lyase
VTTGPTPVILWFRRYLRLHDNPALEAAAATGRPIIPLFILDHGPHTRPIGGASRWWLDRSLRALGAALKSRGAALLLRQGDSEGELRRLIEQTGADAVFMNRLFEPDAFDRDADIAHALAQDGVICRGFNASLLHRPGAVLSGSGAPYRVFTPFLKALLAQLTLPPHTRGPRRIDMPTGLHGDDLDDWALAPTASDWAIDFDWTPGEAGAAAALSLFLDRALATYAEGRDHPGKPGASRLSPHLHWGEISVGQVVSRGRAAAENSRALVPQAEKFVSELAWRDFSAQLLVHFPQMTDRAFRPEFDAIAWRDDPAGLKAWRTGRTGYPIVDAGMRQLWATGWMHNRVRMIVASFLVKDLLIDWREGEAWFWDTLVDADLANNVQNWQWVAGSGADASPFFRVFNPVTQGDKFDGDGAYVRIWVPELAALPDRWLHAPWTAPADILTKAGVRLGIDYPQPVVDHAKARLRALEALKTVTAMRHSAVPED